MVHCARLAVDIQINNNSQHQEVLGGISKLCVRQENTMVSRTCLIWFMMRMRNNLYMLEQPQRMFREFETAWNAWGEKSAKSKTLGSSTLNG